MNKKLSIVVPVYFNEESLPALFERLTTLETNLAARSVDLELIFVDDGSGDNSLRELLNIKEARPATRVVKLSRNFGVVHASKCGLRFVTGDCFMFLSADLQDPPELILQMIERWQAGSKFTICERIGRDDPFTSRIYSTIYYWLVHRLVMSDFPAGGYDMALMDISLATHLLNSSKNMYTPLLTYWLGFKPVVIPYHRQKRQHGKSRWTFKKKFKAFLDVMLGFSVTPIRLISGVGVAVAGLSFTYGIFIIINSLLGNVPVQGFTSLVALITFLLGLIIIMLGIIGEYLWRIFDEVNQRPEVVIDEVY